MTPRFPAACTALLVFTVLFALRGAADTPPQTLPSTPMTKATRMNVIRALNAELVYVRTAFPMGEKGLRLRDGVVKPDGAELQMLLASFGPSVKPGDQARISNVVIHDKSIVFEINGGPREKTKWDQRIAIAGSGGGTPNAPTHPDANAPGSSVELQFQHHCPHLQPTQFKTHLPPPLYFY